MNKKFINNEEAAELISQQGLEFAVVKNPDYIFPPVELYPLSTKITTPRDELSAIVMDMDGTTTTTEELCLHSLEFMVRTISGRMTKDQWAGLDHIIDYPNIIGNSTTKHVEFLITRYNNYIKPQLLAEAYFYAALWTLIIGKDENRKNEVRNNLFNLGCKAVLEDRKLKEFIEKGEFGRNNAHLITNYFLHHYGKCFNADTFNARVRAGVDIYYQRYHEILQQIKNGEGEHLAKELLGGSDKHLIEPMPGVGLFLALIKGWLGEEAVNMYDELEAALAAKHGVNYSKPDRAIVTEKLAKLGVMFRNKPLKVAVVTSSIFYEADIVMCELFHILKQQVGKWNISEEKKELITGKFSDYKLVYDAFITATDSSEIRLKPHRDLYSIALHQLGIPKNQFSNVVGFEDSESGTIAIRAAGIGICVAVPFAKTSGHDLSAASFILHGGLPETILNHNLFIK